MANILQHFNAHSKVKLQWMKGPIYKVLGRPLEGRMRGNLEFKNLSKVVHEVDQMSLVHSCFPHLSMCSKHGKHAPLINLIMA